jgi:hypothetical protein
MTSMKHGWLKWELTMTDHIEAADTPSFYSRILERGLGGVMGATVHWSDE